ncbi:DUF6531 domain-containing protein [Paenibacillus sp. BR2-3]|uniref:DUF6531 domain-containing protein n=1 Tax=Paenibacillus sp. BR2-3 TaxID=3048494 RepID=UPI003977A11E
MDNDRPQKSVWRRGNRLGLIGKCILAFLIVLTGLPLLPNQELPRAYAETSLQISPITLSSVYGGQTRVNFRFDDPDPTDNTQESHDTVISLKRSGSTVATLNSNSYPTETSNYYYWNGLIGSNPAPEGDYQIQVTPTRFPNNGNSGSVQILNPNPPQPKGLEIIRDPESGKYIIRGIAEIGTKVELKMKLIQRVRDNTTFDDEKVETLVTGVPVKPRTSSWALNIPADASYFTNFPERSDNPPAKYIGEWEKQIELPAYKIAEIQAFSIRDFDSKRSTGSEKLNVLKYTAPAWGINWAVVASYYYGVDEKDAIVQMISEIAKFNGFPVEDCNDQVCYGPIDEGVNLWIMNPKHAGEIGHEDDDRIQEEYANRNGHPLPAAFDPVNLATGDFVFKQTNISLQAVMPLDMSLTYHSRDKYDGDFGVGWHHSYERKLEFRENGVLYVTSPEGASYRFDPIAGGKYEGPDGLYDTLVRNTDGSYTQQTPDRISYTYRKDGKLYRIEDANGNRIQLSYHGSLLTEIATDGAKLTLTYGSGGKITRVTDHTGRFASYEYDAVNHDLTAMILPDSGRITYTYDEKHRMTGIKNPNETSELINEYDEQDRVVRQQDFAGVWGDMEYIPDSKRTVTTDALDRKTVYEFDERYRKTSVTYDDGTVERFLYDKNDNMIRMTDRNGSEWEYQYDGSGNLIRAQDPEGYQTEIRYNVFNLPVEFIDPLGRKTALTYDGKGNLTSITDALGGVSKVTVNGKGVPESIINANGEQTSIENDSYGFASLITDPLGNRQELVRDPLHRVSEIVDALGYRTKLQYDPRDRVTARIDALGHTERYEYDKDSNLISYTDASGSRTSYSYSSFGMLASETDALGNTTRYTYDAVGNRIKQTDAAGSETVYEYDSSNRMDSITDPEGSVSTYEYDGNGNVILVKQPNDGSVRIEYDRRNLPVKMTDAAGGVSTFSYDAAGQLTQETDQLGHNVQYAYDALGRLTEETDALGQITSYGYDEAGRLTRTVKPNGAEWKLDYDARGMLVKVTDPLGQTSTMNRDELGQVTGLTDEAGKITSYQYDALGRVTRLVDPLGHATELTYDARGQLTGLKDAKGQSTQYGYDTLGRLLEVTNALGHTTAYRYDALGNITSKTDALGRVTTYDYNRRSELVREAGPLGRITAFAYDSMGNMTDLTSPDGALTRYAYDKLNRLTGIAYPDGKQVGYDYDAAGRRTRMTDELGTTTYAYDALNRLTQVTDSNRKTIKYEWTATGQRSRIEYPEGTSVTYQYDLLDRMTGVTDIEGRTTTYTYDARGLLTSKKLPTLGESTYSYDDAGQLLELRHSNQFQKTLEQLTYSYDPVGNRIGIERKSDGNDEEDTDGNDSEDRIVTDYAYDALNQLVEVQTQNSISTDLPAITRYQYDAVGNRMQRTSQWGELSETESYAYDEADRLTQLTTGSEINDYRYDPRGNLLEVLQKHLDLPEVTALTGDKESSTVVSDVYEAPSGTTAADTGADPLLHADETDPLLAAREAEDWSEAEVIEQYVWNGANRLTGQTNAKGDITRYAYDGDGNRMKMTIDYAHGGSGKGNGKGNGNGNSGKGNSNGNGNGNENSNGNGNGSNTCKVVPPGFIPPGLAKKCGNADEEYPDLHPGGPRDGWEKQFKKEHWELNFTNDVSLALPELIEVAEADSSKWKQTYVYGAGGERLSMTYVPAYDSNNGWEPTPGAGGAEPGVQPKTLWYMQDALGSTLGLVEKDGRVSSRYHYDEFGVPLDAKKFDLNWPGPDNLFGYTGLGYDFTSSNTYARARYYKPEIGRFISEDTYKGDLWNPQSQNEFTYVHNNPLLYVDPSGHFLDVIADIGFILYDAYQYVNDPSWENAGYLALDMGAAFVPFATGAGAAAKATVHATSDAINLAEKVAVIGIKAIDDLWALAPFERGKAIDKLLGNNLGMTFPTFDRAVGDTLISIKSVDPRLASYNKGNYFYNSIKSNINDIVKSDGKFFGKQRFYDGSTELLDFDGTEWKKKALNLALPNVNLTKSQQKQLEKAIEYANSKGVEFMITIVD